VLYRVRRALVNYEVHADDLIHPPTNLRAVRYVRMKSSSVWSVDKVNSCISYDAAPLLKTYRESSVPHNVEELLWDFSSGVRNFSIVSVLNELSSCLVSSFLLPFLVVPGRTQSGI
jgi:hypothetical protein